MNRAKWIMIDGQAINTEDIFSVNVDRYYGDIHSHVVTVQSVLGAKVNFYIDAWDEPKLRFNHDLGYNKALAKQREIMEKLGIQIEGV